MNINYLSYINQLITHLEANNYKGYDPYDALNMPLPWHKMGRIFPALFIQLMKRLPINIRPLLRIRKGYNPKAMGLFLHAFCILYKKTGNGNYLKKANFFFNWLMEHPSKGYSGMSWGYNFLWKSPIRDLPAYTPSAVVTAFICRGILAYYHITADKRAAQALHGAADFVINALPRVSDETGISFSYTPLQTEVCYNASLLAAEILSYSHSVQPNKDYALLAEKAAEFVLARQYEDGSWAYSEKSETSQVRVQIDFHQGYVLESLHILAVKLGELHPNIRPAITSGLNFYRQKQFLECGQPKYRLPENYPIDIHHVAQGIITFSRLDKAGQYEAFQDKVASWAIKNMYSTRKGYFYYRKYKGYTNRINYVRWGQAWMLLALAEIY